MRRFMLGRLRFTPDELGRMKLRDIFDAVNGYNEEDDAKFRRLANLVRTATSVLWNTQVKEEARVDADELWRFAWEVEKCTEEEKDEYAEEKARLIERHKELLAGF